MNLTDHTLDPGRRALLGFVAGFLATLVFHQFTLLLLYVANVSPFGAFPMAPTAPLGVPVLFSLAFWGGVWGILYVFVHHRFPAGTGYWIAALLFGGILTSIVALFVVSPLQGGPVAAGGNLRVLIVVFLINGAWGVGTGLFIGWLAGPFGARSSTAL